MNGASIFIAFVLSLNTLVFAQDKIIIVDFNTNLGRLKNLNGINGIPGNALQGYKDAGFYLVRTHPRGDNTDYDAYTTFFNKSTMLFNQNFDPTNPDNYNWTLPDASIASIENNGFKTYFRIGVPWPGRTTPTAPPLDPDGINFTKFAEICKRTVMHYNEGWDNGFHYGIQYWEIWNEPDGRFWDGTPQQFYRLYEASANAIKSLDSDLMVGGPSVTPGAIVPKDPEYFPDFLSDLRDNNAPLDFFSWHLYKVYDPYKVKEHSEYVRKTLDQYGFYKTESHLNEINIDLGGSRSQDLNSPKGAAYVASTLITLQFSPVDELMWFRGQSHGMGIFDSDVAGEPRYRWNGLPFKMMNYMVKETPVRIAALGADTVSVDKNFMVLAGKSENKRKVYLIVSNYAGSIQDFTVSLTNLPWDERGEIELTTNIVNEANFFTESIESFTGSSTILKTLTDSESPSVYLLRFQYKEKIK